MTHKIYLNVHDPRLVSALTEILTATQTYQISDSMNDCDIILSDREEGGDVFLRPPLKLEKLFREIHRYLSQKTFSFGAFTVDIRHKELVSSTSREHLTEKEIQLLKSLYDHRGRAVHKLDLLESVWGYGAQIDTHTLETHIYRLRQKIEADPTSPQILVNQDDGYLLQV